MNNYRNNIDIATFREVEIIKRAAQASGCLGGNRNSFMCLPGTQVFKLPLSDKLVLAMEGRFPNLRCSFTYSIIEAVARAR